MSIVVTFRQDCDDGAGPFGPVVVIRRESESLDEAAARRGGALFAYSQGEGDRSPVEDPVRGGSGCGRSQRRTDGLVSAVAPCRAVGKDRPPVHNGASRRPASQGLREAGKVVPQGDGSAPPFCDLRSIPSPCGTTIQAHHYAAGVVVARRSHE